MELSMEYAAKPIPPCDRYRRAFLRMPEFAVMNPWFTAERVKCAMQLLRFLNQSNDYVSLVEVARRMGLPTSSAGDPRWLANRVLVGPIRCVGRFLMEELNWECPAVAHAPRPLDGVSWATFLMCRDAGGDLESLEFCLLPEVRDALTDVPWCGGEWGS